MLDLNQKPSTETHSADGESSTASQLMTGTIPAGSRTRLIESGTSIATAINLCDDRDSSPTHNGIRLINFGILKDESEEDNASNGPAQSTPPPRSTDPVTLQLFPETPGDAGGVQPTSMATMASSSSNSNNAGTAVAEERPPPPGPVRRGGRGPRPRSSPYRGVTFNRRTGRWESHIWLDVQTIRAARQGGRWR